MKKTLFIILCILDRICRERFGAGNAAGSVRTEGSEGSGCSSKEIAEWA